MGTRWQMAWLRALSIYADLQNTGQIRWRGIVDAPFSRHYQKPSFNPLDQRRFSRSAARRAGCGLARCGSDDIRALTVLKGGKCLYIENSLFREKRWTNRLNPQERRNSTLSSAGSDKKCRRMVFAWPILVWPHSVAIRRVPVCGWRRSM